MRNDDSATNQFVRILVHDHQRTLEEQARLARVRRRTRRRRDAPDTPVR